MRKVKVFVPGPLFHFLQPAYHLLLAFFASLLCGFPSRLVKVIGVTGTSGKTTTIEFLHAIFSEAGFKTASLSSLRFKILGSETPNLLKMTMPGRFFIQKFLYEAKREGCEYVFLEVTSEGVKQFRHKFITFYAAILTNLSPEHLESHGGFENYRAAKGKLFFSSPIHVLNVEDPHVEYFLKIPGREKICYTPSDFPKDIKLRLWGEFNKNNASAALAFARHEKISDEISKRALERIEALPGRMEFIETGKDFKVIVDYAFLPQTLRKVYETLVRDSDFRFRVSGNLICVLGAAGGGRDKWKRPVLGDVAREFCKKVFVTNEDPYDEDPLQIMNEVAGAHNFEKILERREAIREALKSAQSGDIVVITGKGAEPWIMGPNGAKVSWDDRRVAREELTAIERTHGV